MEPLLTCLQLDDFSSFLITIVSIRGVWGRVRDKFPHPFLSDLGERPSEKSTNSTWVLSNRARRLSTMWESMFLVRSPGLFLVSLTFGSGWIYFDNNPMKMTPSSREYIQRLLYHKWRTWPRACWDFPGLSFLCGMSIGRSSCSSIWSAALYNE